MYVWIVIRRQRETENELKIIYRICGTLQTFIFSKICVTIFKVYFNLKKHDQFLYVAYMIYTCTCTIILHITRIVNLHIHVQSFIAWLQSRYVGYYERVKKDLGGHLPPETKKRITSVKIEGLKGQYKYFGL